ncbi:RNA ligase [uncultured virus]|nr:RNA ligase [uncultured virus]
MEGNIDSTRALASIQIVQTVEKHPNFQKLELATVLGWQVVTNLGEVVEDTKVVYCEIDSMLPVGAVWLPPSVKERIAREKIRGYFHVNTIMMRGEISQGLIITLAKLPELLTLEEGTDVTEILGIQKYEPLALTGRFVTRQIGNKFPNKTDNGIKFPSKLIDKTDEFRVQSHPRLFSRLQGNPYYITVKLDGISSSFLLNPETKEILVCSRNIIRDRPSDVSTCPYWFVAVKYGLDEKLKLMSHIAIQGEICGPGIQKNLLGLKDVEFFVFNCVDTRNKQRLTLKEMIKICNKLGLKMVPVIEEGQIYTCESIKSLLNQSRGTYSGTTNAREGLVVRSSDQIISFKAINNDYLIKHGY